ILFLSIETVSHAQPAHQISLGIFSRITSTYTWDEGIFNDARFQERYDVKLAPIGINYGIDFVTWGFVFTPGIINIGQNYHIINTVGGHEGTRKVNLRYATIPFALKFHAIDMAFFRVSLAGGVGVGFLVDGKETITHNYAKYRFPLQSYPSLPSDYMVEYDGVLAPETSSLVIADRDDYNPIQVTFSGGFRSDWDLSDEWRISLDVRINYGLFDNRSSDYLARIDAYESIYDTPGKRRDIFATVNIGISRFVEIDAKREAHTKPAKKFIPKKNPFQEMKKKKGKKKKGRLY